MLDAILIGLLIFLLPLLALFLFPLISWCAWPHFEPWEQKFPEVRENLERGGVKFHHGLGALSILGILFPVVFLDDSSNFLYYQHKGLFIFLLPVSTLLLSIASSGTFKRYRKILFVISLICFAAFIETSEIIEICESCLVKPF